MKGLFRFGVTLSMVLSFYNATTYASQCTSEQMQKMAQGGLSMQEITQICDTSGTLSPEEAMEKIKAFAAKNINQVTWYWIPLPRPGYARVQNITEYYQALKEAGYITSWEEDRGERGEMKLQLTQKGKKFIYTGKSSEGKYSVSCCNFEPGFDVTCLGVDPRGGVRGKFEVSPTDPFQLWQYVATRNPHTIDGEAEFIRHEDGWKVKSVWLKSHIEW
jgi:hypothetical protein